MKRFFLPSAILLILGTLFFGVIYPFFVWTIAHIFFSWQAEGSPVIDHGKIVGLYYVGQSFSDDRYFWSRPSWGYRVKGIKVSGGSNLSWLSPLLRANVEYRSRMWEQGNVPEDMIMASASGCDPEISVRAALAQIPRIAHVRGVSVESLRDLVLQCEEGCGDLCPRRVNLLRLNMAVDNI